MCSERWVRLLDPPQARTQRLADICARPLGRRVGFRRELENVKLLAGSGQQLPQILQALGVPETNDDALEADSPVFPFAPEDGGERVELRLHDGRVREQASLGRDGLVVKL